MGGSGVLRPGLPSSQPPLHRLPTLPTSRREPQAARVLISVPAPTLTGALQGRDRGSSQMVLVLATVFIRVAAPLHGVGLRGWAQGGQSTWGLSRDQ